MKKILFTIGFIALAFQEASAATSGIDLSTLEDVNRKTLAAMGTPVGHLHFSGLMTEERAPILRRFDGLVSNALRFAPAIGATVDGVLVTGGNVIRLALEAYEASKAGLSHTDGLHLTPVEALMPAWDFNKSFAKRIGELNKFIDARDAHRTNIDHATRAEILSTKELEEAQTALAQRQGVVDAATTTYTALLGLNRLPEFSTLSKATATLAGRSTSKGGPVTVAQRIAELQKMGDDTSRTAALNTELQTLDGALKGFLTASEGRVASFDDYKETLRNAQLALEGAKLALHSATEVRDLKQRTDRLREERLAEEQKALADVTSNADTLSAQLRGKILRVLDEFPTIRFFRVEARKQALIGQLRAALAVLEKGGFSLEGKALSKKKKEVAALTAAQADEIRTRIV